MGRFANLRPCPRCNLKEGQYMKIKGRWSVVCMSCGLVGPGNNQRCFSGWDWNRMSRLRELAKECAEIDAVPLHSVRELVAKAIRKGELSVRVPTHLVDVLLLVYDRTVASRVSVPQAQDAADAVPPHRLDRPAVGPHPLGNIAPR